MILEPEHWTTWLERHGRPLLLYARGFARDLHDAEDLVQEAFLRFWPARQRVADPLPFLYACVRHVAFDTTRGDRRRARREQAVTAPAAPLFDAPLEAAERREALERALAELPPEQREVVVLKIWAGLTYEQIGAALSIPPNTAASRHRYALLALQNLVPVELRP